MAQTQTSSRDPRQLISHCRELIRKGPFHTGRISRGQYWISYLLLVGLSTLISTLVRRIFWNSGDMVTSIIWIILAVFQIKLIIKRSHDIGENKRYAFIPLFAIVGFTVLAGIIIYFVGSYQAISLNTTSPEALLSSWFGKGAGIVLLILLMRSIVRSFKLIFKKWNKGDNIYGFDPLLSQPESNGTYWIAWLAIAVLAIIIWSLGRPSPYGLQNMTMQGPKIMEWTGTEIMESTP